MESGPAPNLAPVPLENGQPALVHTRLGVDNVTGRVEPGPLDG
jgi:hypothetical protein